MSEEREKNIKASFVIGMLLLLGGVWMFGKMTVFDSIQAMATKSWPTTVGRVVSTSVKKISSTGKPVRRYEPVVRYEYTVQGVKYSSDRIHFGDQVTDETGAESKVADYPAGQEVEVRYDPDDPARAALQTNFKFNIFVPPVGIGMIIAGLFSIRFALREARKAKHEGRPEAGG